MLRAPRAPVLLLAAVTALAASAAVRVASHWPGARVELSSAKSTVVSAAARARLASLRDQVFLTYYVSAREAMPSHLRHLEAGVDQVLAALARASAGVLEYQLVDPGSDPDLARYASRRKVAPVRVRHVERDAYSEQTIWSSLQIAYGAHRPAVIDGIRPEHLPHLQALILAHLDQMESPRPPVIALATPVGGAATYEHLRAALSEKNRVVRVDLAGSQPIPDEADALLWMDPLEVPPSRLRELQHFLERGRSVVVAGSLNEVEIDAGGGKPSVRVRPSGYGAESLLSEFGLAPIRGLVADGFASEQLEVEGAKIDAPFLIRCIAPNQDFHTLKGQPNGNLLFAAPTPFLLDGDRLAARRYRAELLATTSEETWVQPVPSEPLALADVTPERGAAAPKLPLIALLRHDDPTRGLVFFCAASTPFRDGSYAREGTAHWRLVRTLVDNAASNERVVLARAGIGARQPIPELSPAARLFWRAACVLLLPAALLALAAARGAFRRAPAPMRARRPWWVPVALRAAAASVAISIAAAAAGRFGISADASADGTNRLAPGARAEAERARGPHAARVETFFSPRDRLPPAMRPRAAGALDVLRNFERAGAELDIVRVAPEDLDAGARARLAREGIEPVTVTTQEEEVTSVRTVYSALRVSSGGRSAVLRFPDERSFDLLEFRLAFALWRLRTGERPVVAFASDLPRPTAAEAYEEYQQQGLFAPMGVDVYSLAREAVQGADFEVVHLSPRDPVVPEGADALLWIQPRRSCERMMEAMLTYLHRGGRVMLAAQHFVWQSRQFPGRTFDVDYWPAPQNADVEIHYFPWLGVGLVRQPLFDELKTRYVLESQIKRGAQREFSGQETSQYFLIRASAQNFAADSLVTRNLGDQAFLFGNWFDLDRARLAENGITHRTLVTTTERTWQYAWKGGYFPPRDKTWNPLDGPERDAGGAPQYLGKVPLAIELEGLFPYPPERIAKEPPALGPDGQPLADQPPAPTWPTREEDPGASGKLVFFGGSELFKNNRLYDPEFRADQLLLNTAAYLALEPELAAVISKRPVRRGLELVEPAARQRWRTIVLGAFPAALLAFGLLRWLLMGRAGGPVEPAA